MISWCFFCCSGQTGDGKDLKIAKKKKSLKAPKDTWTKADISPSNGVDKRGKVMKDGYMGSFKYGKLNQEHERRDTEDNYKIYYPKKDTFRSETNSIDT